MKKIFVLLIVLFCSANCYAGLFEISNGDVKTGGDTDIKQARQLKKLLAEGDRRTGLPNITNYQQKKLMKLVYEMCDKENLICYAYIKSDYHGKLVFIGKCLGFGIPFSAQYTNPMKMIDSEIEGGIKNKMNDNGEVQVLPQADPNGLFMPTSSSATWLMMIDPKTSKPRPVYLEPEIVVSPFPLHKGVNNVSQ